MSTYGKVYRQYWTWAKREGLSQNARELGAYLLSCEHSNLLGCYRLPVVYAADDLDYSPEDVRAALEQLQQLDFIQYDTRSNFVFIVKFLEWNPLENPNQFKSADVLAAAIPGSVPFRANVLASIAAAKESRKAKKASDAPPQANLPLDEAKPDAPKLEVVRGGETLSKGFRKGSETVSKPVTVTGAVTETASGTGNPPLPRPGGEVAASDPPGDEDREVRDAVKRVLDGCGISGGKAQKLQPTFRAALELGMRSRHGTAGAIGDAMLSSWREYVGLGDARRIAYGAPRFFSEGIWLNPGAWPLQQEVLERRRMQMQASVGYRM